MRSTFIGAIITSAILVLDWTAERLARELFEVEIDPTRPRYRL